jgi:hypothetical protein
VSDRVTGTSVTLPTHFRKSDCEEASIVANEIGELRVITSFWKLGNSGGRSISGFVRSCTEGSRPFTTEGGNAGEG